MDFDFNTPAMNTVLVLVVRERRDIFRARWCARRVRACVRAGREAADNNRTDGMKDVDKNRTWNGDSSCRPRCSLQRDFVRRVFPTGTGLGNRL